MRWVLLLIPGLLLALALLLHPSAPPPPRARLALRDVMAAPPGKEFAQALQPRPFRFPEDHGPHPGFATEWWYFTGNLEDGKGRPFGYQLTFFRKALAARPAPRASAWASSGAWMAHLALTDPEAGRHRAWERFSREALDLAGAQARPFKVWLEDWEVSGDPIRLRAGAEDFRLELTLTPQRPPVLQGDRGLSRKGSQPGNASYYYSLTRLLTRGRLEAGGRSYPVNGLSWMDREWGTSALEPGQTGWDWFSLQLSDGSDLMVYRLRRADGQTPTVSGSLTGASGTRILGASDLRMEPRGSWRDAEGTDWPVRWHLEVPTSGLALEVEPCLDDQEMNLAVPYWEGAIEARGSREGRPVEGRGYLELTGYGPEGLRGGGR